MNRHVQRSKKSSKKLSELGVDYVSNRSASSWHTYCHLQPQYSRKSPNNKKSNLYYKNNGLNLVQREYKCSELPAKSYLCNEGRQEDEEDVRLVEESHWRILIVGDKTSNLALKNHLASQPFKIQFVNSDSEALKHIRRQVPNLIIYNIILPHMDGVELLRQLNNIYGAEDLPTIFLLEEKHLNSLVYTVEYGSIDYLIKPFDKHELLSMIQRLLAILSARDRLTRLRTFTTQVARIKDIDTLLNRTYSFLQEEPCLEDVTLFRGGDLVHSNSVNLSFIEKLFEKVEESASINDCYTLNQRGYTYLYFRLPDMHIWTFIVRVKNAPTSGVELEYIQNVMHQARMIKDNLRATLCDSGTITNLYAIISKKDQILFVKSARQYVELYAKRHRPELLTISLSTVCLYLKDYLLKVHRSYLVNPQEVQHVRRKKQGRYEILINEHVIPVGEVFLPLLREKYSHWFKNPILCR